MSLWAVPVGKTVLCKKKRVLIRKPLSSDVQMFFFVLDKFPFPLISGW